MFTTSAKGIAILPFCGPYVLQAMASSRNVLFTCRGAFPLALALVQLLAGRPEAAGHHSSRSLQSGAPRQPLGSQASSHRSCCSAATNKPLYLQI